MRKQSKRWTDEEIKFLRWCAGEEPMAYCARKLERSQDAVREKARLLGLRWSGQRTLKGIAELLGVHWQTIMKHRDLLQLKFRKRSPRSGFTSRTIDDKDIPHLATSILAVETDHRGQIINKVFKPGAVKRLRAAVRGELELA